MAQSLLQKRPLSAEDALAAVETAKKMRRMDSGELEHEVFMAHAQGRPDPALALTQTREADLICDDSDGESTAPEMPKLVDDKASDDEGDYLAKFLSRKYCMIHLSEPEDEPCSMIHLGPPCKSYSKLLVDDKASDDKATIARAHCESSYIEL